MKTHKQLTRRVCWVVQLTPEGTPYQFSNREIARKALREYQETGTWRLLLQFGRPVDNRLKVI